MEEYFHVSLPNIKFIFACIDCVSLYFFDNYGKTLKLLV
jgi:hypothetical protein